MAGKHRGWRTALVLMVGLLLPSQALAGPYLGEWSCWWRPAPDCPRGEYSPHHYWAPTWYVFRSCVRPSNLDQYPPGPYPPIGPTFDTQKYPCVSTPPAPSSPYADPSRYYGRPITPP